MDPVVAKGSRDGSRKFAQHRRPVEGDQHQGGDHSVVRAGRHSPGARAHPGNYRAYGTSHLERLSFARRARNLGFSLEQVRELLRLADDRDKSCEAVDRVAREHLDEVERKIADLEAPRRELRDLIRQCRHGTVAECRILGALSPRGVIRHRRGTLSGIPSSI